MRYLQGSLAHRPQPQPSLPGLLFKLPSPTTWSPIFCSCLQCPHLPCVITSPCPISLQCDSPHEGNLRVTVVTNFALCAGPSS